MPLQLPPPTEDMFASPAFVLPAARELVTMGYMHAWPPARPAGVGISAAEVALAHAAAGSGEGGAPPPLLDPFRDLRVEMTPDRVEGERRAGELVAGMLASPCERLPHLPALVAVAEQRRWLRRRVEQLTSALDADDSLRLLPDAEAKIGVLVHYGYLSADGERAVTEKGRVACEVRTSFDELVLAELIFSGALDALAANEVAALLSCFVSKGKEPSDEQLAAALVPPLRDARLALVALTTDVATVQLARGVITHSAEEHVRSVLNFAMIEVAYLWASGRPFAEVCKRTPLLEGDIVRNIARLDEVAKEVKFAARVRGDAVLLAKMDDVSNAVKRDIVFAASLYTSGGQ